MNIKALIRQLFFKHATTQKTKTLIQVAKVLAIEPHPNADRLVLVRLETKQGELYPVVCGAKNFKVGDTVALALPGATISQNIHSSEHEAFTLEKATIRGIESQGMLCAEFELGLTETPGEGIAILPKDAPLGSDALEILRHT